MGGTASLLAACSQPPAAPPREARKTPPNVIVYLADTLRADHLQCYGYRRQSSPNIARFAAKSTVFERCYAASSWTKPACASLFTGVYPSVHGMTLGSWCPETEGGEELPVLNPKLTTLDQVFASNGYNTAWFLANAHVRREFGVGRGFEHYHFVSTEPPDIQMDLVLEWLQDGPREPFFMFVHEVDPHDPYLSTTEEFEAYTGKTHEEALQALPEEEAAYLHDFHLLNWQDRRDTTGRLRLDHLSPTAMDYIRLLYDTEITRVDRVFQRLIDHLDKSGLAEDTVVVLMSDHGEAFNEHGFCYHGDSLYNEELHIPLVVRLPWLREPRRSTTLCSEIDIGATLLSLAGLEAPGHAQGVALLDREGGLRPRPGGPVFAHLANCSTNSEDWTLAALHDRHKILRANASAPWQGYDLVRDAGEQKNRYAEGADPWKSLVRATLEAEAQHRAMAATYGVKETTQVAPPGHHEELEALGYL